ncbi:hypothetical protein ISN44_As09g022160, partial [Arabidopsis suecica]
EYSTNFYSSYSITKVTNDHQSLATAIKLCETCEYHTKPEKHCESCNHQSKLHQFCDNQDTPAASAQSKRTLK